MTVGDIVVVMACYGLLILGPLLVVAVMLP
jgi:hypothetical protein